MDSEGITLSEISQTEIQDTVSYHSYVESKKILKMNITKQKQIHTYRG